jgi:hypothetical protein
MLKKLSFLIFLFPFLAISQNSYKYVYNDSIEVVKDGELLQNAWAGGLNKPQIGRIDVNFDCYYDIVIFDRETDQLRVYISDTNTNVESYHYAPEYTSYFPDSLVDFVLFRDYNMDGKIDIFSHVPGGLQLHTNISDSILKFELTIPLLYTKSSGQIYVVSVDFPCIDDIDGDGDLDVISTHQYGTYLSYYENVSPTTDTMIFELDPSCWGGFIEDVRNDSIKLGYNCKGGGSSNSGSVARHTGGTLTTIDLTNSGAKDLLIGDAGYSNIIKLENGGTNTAAKMTSVDYSYPGSTNVAIDLPIFPVTFFEDVNNDGRKDLIVASNDRYSGADTGNVWMYENFGANTLPNFHLDKKDFLVGQQIDVGTLAYPVLADISGDSLPDLLIGNYGYFVHYNDTTSITTYSSQIAYFKNTGTSSKPSFELITDDLANLSSKGLDRICPTFADIDGDGDNDLLFGENNGKISFYENVAPLGSLANFVLVTDNFMNQNYGVQPSPFLYDVNKDNTLDLLVGQKNGNIKLFLNQGTTNTPLYDTAITDTLGGIQNYYYGYKSNALPFIGKLKGDTNNVLVVADGGGVLRFYDGIDDNLLGDYIQSDSIILSNSAIAVAGANLNDNDSLELIVGENTGGVMYLNMNETQFDYKPYPRDTCGQGEPDNVFEIRNPAEQFKIYPNPNNGNFEVQFKTIIKGPGSLVIYDLSGKQMVNQQVVVTDISTPISVKANQLKAGVYLVQIQMENRTLRSKMVVQ